MFEVLQSNYLNEILRTFLIIYFSLYDIIGILAIAKPCSVVIDIKELFGSESSTQVYAHMHDLLQHPSMQNIGKTILYPLN